MEEIVKNLKENVGNTIKIKGKKANGLWQHMQKNIETHQIINYINIDDTYQIVAYTKDKIKCEDRIELTGEIIELRGSKHPRSKVDESFSEYQMIVDSWKCID